VRGQNEPGRGAACQGPKEWTEDQVATVVTIERAFSWELRSPLLIGALQRANARIVSDSRVASAPALICLPTW
jgi:hypothetical protein